MNIKCGLDDAYKTKNKIRIHSFTVTLTNEIIERISDLSVKSRILSSNVKKIEQKKKKKTWILKF